MQRKVNGSLPCTGTAGGTDRSPRGRTLTIDWKVRNELMRGRFELDFLDVPGRDLSGIVVGTGSNAPEFAVGDEVFGVCPPTRWGSRAELAAVYAAADFRDAVSDLDVVTARGDVLLRSQSALKPGVPLVGLNAAPVPDSPRREDIRISTPPVAYECAGTKRIAALLEEGAVRPTVGATFALDRAVETYRLSETGHVRSELVIRVE